MQVLDRIKDQESLRHSWRRAKTWQDYSQIHCPIQRTDCQRWSLLTSLWEAVQWYWRSEKKKQRVGRKGELRNNIRGDMKATGGHAGQCRSLMGKPIIHMEEDGVRILHHIIHVTQHG